MGRINKTAILYTGFCMENNDGLNCYTHRSEIPECDNGIMDVFKHGTYYGMLSIIIPNVHKNAKNTERHNCAVL